MKSYDSSLRQESLLFHQRALMALVAGQWNWEHEETKLVEFVTQTLGGTGIRWKASDTRTKTVQVPPAGPFARSSPLEVQDEG